MTPWAGAGAVIEPGPGPVAVPGPPAAPRRVTASRLSLLNPAWITVLGATALCLIGITAIGTVDPAEAARQVAHLGVGLIAATLIAIPHYRHLARFSLPLSILVLGCLVILLAPGVPEWLVRPRNGARRWISVAVTDFQPSELAKIVYVLVLAGYLRYRRNHRRLAGLLLPFALTFVPCALIAAEPDLGTALLFLPTLFAMLAAAGARMRHLVLIGLLGVVSAPLAYPFLQTHQRNRVQALWYQLRGDDRFERTIGYQGSKAMMLAGAGGLTGAGRTMAAELVERNHLPERHNDMIFAVIACRWGLLGAAATLSLFLMATLGGLLTAGRCRDPSGRLIAVGMTTMLLVQMVVNTGMTVGVMFITGMTLPFVSYGGSSMVTAWLMVGLILNVGLRRPVYLLREPFEFEDA
ncbi:MAG: FtsW/RodA/SpoVE family cell cycle protein [Phycisphaeraceae bacterium]|nr:FtsW/RodA/SpoVE family cell cycle protein [Phycisphaeraceae bacterium]